jgi:UDP-N-acetylglucosamine 2-epimerase (non-hydrolysing)
MPAWVTIAGPKPGGKLRQSCIALVVGTRPEAIKLSPVAQAFADFGSLPHLLVTGQHPGLELGDHGLDQFAATPLNCPGQPDPMLHADLVRCAIKRVLKQRRPDLLVVQGDTSSALGAALAARELGITLAHVEAGLRTYDPNMPWPEEENRVTIDRLSDLLFAPTSANAANLRREAVRGDIHVTGNSGVDALAALVGALPVQPRRRWWPRRQFQLLVTCHRRENWGPNLEHLAEALIQLGAQGIQSLVILPPNPTVTERLTSLCDGKPGIQLSPALSHHATIAAMREADLVLSDSGGMQEEAPPLGVPLLVLREKTERPESIAAGNCMLVGMNAQKIAETVEWLRADRAELASMRKPAMPFGDGQASSRIARHCLAFLANQDVIEQGRRA